MMTAEASAVYGLCVGVMKRLLIFFGVIIEPEVCDEFFSHDVAESVFEFGFLDEEIVLGVEPFSDLGAFEEEGHPFLYAVEARALGEIEGQSDIERDRGGEDGVAAEEIDLDLHGVAQPTEDVDVVPSFFRVAARGIIFDTDFVIVIFVQFREGFSV